VFGAPVDQHHAAIVGSSGTDMVHLTRAPRAVEVQGIVHIPNVSAHDWSLFKKGTR
jgi:hypothetical protein